MNLDQELSAEQHGEATILGTFLKQFDEERFVDKKIRLAIDFMRSALSQREFPRFRDFWEGRSLCLSLFKEAMDSKLRALLWGDYIEVSQEARRLREILDEESAFAAEQIELAIAALEKDLDGYEEVLRETFANHLPLNSESLKNSSVNYDDLQGELTLLNRLAAHVNALRKEVVKTEMRVRHKNRFFERLSSIGDRVFPKRKELIKTISDAFIHDIEEFSRIYFQEPKQHTLPLFVLREEIKSLQTVAKVLTLNTQAFTETRLRLSACWDEIRERDKERKKEITVKRQLFRQNCDLVLEKIKLFGEKILANSLSQEDENAESGQILDAMKSMELGREEVAALREELQKARQPLLDRIYQEERAKECQRKERVEEFKARLILLLSEGEGMDHERILSEREALLKELALLPCTRAEKQNMDHLFKELKEAMEERRERALLNLSEDDLKSFGQLKTILEERKCERQKIRDQLEIYRKALGISGFDFEKAFAFQEMIENENSRLDKVNASIEEIEERIARCEF
jgi:hypothetical protein